MLRKPSQAFYRISVLKNIKLIEKHGVLYLLQLQENTCYVDHLLIKLQPRPPTLLKEGRQISCFPVNFLKFFQIRSSAKLLWRTPQKGRHNVFEALQQNSAKHRNK